MNIKLQTKSTDETLGQLSPCERAMLQNPPLVFTLPNQRGKGSSCTQDTTNLLFLWMERVSKRE